MAPSTIGEGVFASIAIVMKCEKNIKKRLNAFNNNSYFKLFLKSLSLIVRAGLIIIFNRIKILIKKVFQTLTHRAKIALAVLFLNKKGCDLIDRGFAGLFFENTREFLKITYKS